MVSKRYILLQVIYWIKSKATFKKIGWRIEFDSLHVWWLIDVVTFPVNLQN